MPRTNAADTQIAATASTAKMDDRIGKITSDLSFCKTCQLCFVNAQPRLMLPMSGDFSPAGDKRRAPERAVTRCWHHRPVTGQLHVHSFGPPGPVQLLALHGLTGHGRRW